jgi:type III secretion protein J
LVVCGLLLASACTTRLQHELNEEDANEIYVLLRKHGIDAVKDREGEGKDARFIISVPKADAQQGAELLREHSLPRPHADGLAIFKQTKGMIPTQTEERAMFIEALGGEVSNALNRIPGVLESRVIVMIPEINDLTQPEKRPMPSAAVLVKYIGGEGGVVPVSIDDVQGFVANSVPEMKKESVKVIMTPAKFVADASDEPQFKSVLGMNVQAGSATTLKMVLGLLILLLVAMAGAVGWLAVRKPATNGRPPPRSRTQD